MGTTSAFVVEIPPRQSLQTRAVPLESRVLLTLIKMKSETVRLLNSFIYFCPRRFTTISSITPTKKKP